MDTFLGPYFYFCLELALETWVEALLIHSLRVYYLGHTHSLASVQQSGPSDQRTFLWTKGCLNCQKWSPYKVKAAFSTLIRARKQTNCPPGIIDHATATLRCQAEDTFYVGSQPWTHPLISKHSVVRALRPENAPLD